MSDPSPKLCLLLCHAVYHFFTHSSGRVMKIFPGQIYSCECEPHWEQRWYFPIPKRYVSTRMKKKKKKDKGVKTWMCMCMKMNWTSWCPFLCPTDLQLCISGPDLFSLSVSWLLMAIGHLHLGIQFLKSKYVGTSLVVQWFKTLPSNAGDAGLIPGQGKRRSHVCNAKKGLHVATKTWCSQINK